MVSVAAQRPSVPAEMSLEHVQRLRFALDRALQPIGEFAGFDVRDSFQTSALRYQINFLAYGIALTQACFTPAFDGYMHEAQRRLIGKLMQHRVWSCWAREGIKMGRQAWRQHLEAEFLDGFGRYVPRRSARTGSTLPVVGGVMPQALPCYFLNVVAPDLALRQWILLRRQLFDQQGRLRRRAFWPIDTANCGFLRAGPYAATALAAAELGDEDVYEHCFSALEDECPSMLEDGVMHRPRVSVWSHGAELMARANGRDGFRRLATRKPMSTGPSLGQVAYPDVLVASAHAEAERSTLQAVLYAGAGDGTQSIEVLGLRPHQHYRVHGATVDRFRADALGRASLQVSLIGRTCLALGPACE